MEGFGWSVALLRHDVQKIGEGANLPHRFAVGGGFAIDVQPDRSNAYASGSDDVAAIAVTDVNGLFGRDVHRRQSDVEDVWIGLRRFRFT